MALAGLGALAEQACEPALDQARASGNPATDHATRLPGLGSGGYEGIQNDSAGNVWLVEDIGGAAVSGGKKPNSYLYRFTPKNKTDLAQGVSGADLVQAMTLLAPALHFTDAATGAVKAVAGGTGRGLRQDRLHLRRRRRWCCSAPARSRECRGPSRRRP